MPTKTIKTPKPTKARRKSKIKAVATKKTYVAIVVDRSGSMASIHKQTVDAINEQLGAIRANIDKSGDTLITMVQFDSVIDVLTDASPVDKVKNWELSDFVPRGGTAMYDGVWAAINSFKSKQIDKDTGFLVCVISDGEENSSREVTQAQLSAEIKRLQDTGHWTFTYMLANQDIHAVSARMNVPVSNFASFTNTVAGLQSASYAMTSSYSSYANSRMLGANQVTAYYVNTDTK